MASARQSTRRSAVSSSETGAPPLQAKVSVAPLLDRQTPHNLPIQPTPLLDREREVAAVLTLLQQNDVWLVTLTGPAGVGKTRLALEVAAALALPPADPGHVGHAFHAFNDGIWFVRLAPVANPNLVIPTIARTLGLREVGSQPIQEVLRVWLHSKRLLLLLDNCEQVAAAGPEVADLLAVCPGLKVLATSRVVFRLRGEKAYPVPPLGLPHSGHFQGLENLADCAAVALFLQRAQDATPDFALTAANGPVLAEICTRLDGLPLAIELAAARITLLSPTQLLQRLEPRLPLLTGGARDLEEHQQTMQTAIRWSEDLLSPDERVLFRRLAVFVGGFTIEAAEAVCVASEGIEPLRLEVLDGLDTLVNQSLVQTWRLGEDAGEATRFRLLHVVREYALEQCDAGAGGNEGNALRQGHLAYYLALAEKADMELTGPRQRVWLDRLEQEHDNLRAALAWARGYGDADRETRERGLRLAGALRQFWRLRGYLSEGRAWVRRLLDVAEPDQAQAEARAQGYYTMGSLAFFQGDYGPAGASLEVALALAQSVKDWRTAAWTLHYLGNVALSQGDYARAVTRQEECQALAREAGDLEGVAWALLGLGVAADFQREFARAAERYEEAAVLMRQCGDQEGLAVVGTCQGYLAWREGDLRRATTLGRAALAWCRALSAPLRLAEAMELLGVTCIAAHRGRQAARLLGTAATLREAVGAPLSSVDRQGIAQAVATTRAALGEAAWAAAFATGQALSMEEAIAEALEASV